MTVFIKLDHCCFKFKGTTHEIVHDISLSVEAGRYVRLVGPSGCGKTTLALLIAGLIKPVSGTVTRCEAVKKVRFPIRMVFQDPFASMDPRWTVNRWLHDIKPAAGGLDRVKELCHQFDLDAVLIGMTPSELSGGECQRFNLVAALIGDPRVLILDESMSMVGKEAATAMRRVIEEQRRRTGMAVVVIEHTATLPNDIDYKKGLHFMISKDYPIGEPMKIGHI